MVKKTAIVFFAVFLLIAVWVQTQKSVFDGFDGRITYYTASSSSNANIIVGKPKALILDLTGESVEIDEELDLNDILSRFDATLVFSERIEEGICYYAYSDKIKYSAKLSGRKINLHIYIKEGKTVMGTSMIFGSF